MQKSKFISVLRQLRHEEMAEFAKFLKQYHKKDKTALRVFQYVYAHFPDFNHPNLSLELAYPEIYNTPLPESPLETKNRLAKKLLNKLSELSLWLEDFLWHQKISKPSAEKDLIWATILIERNLYPELSKHRLSLKKNLTQILPEDIPGYLNLMVASYLTNYHSAELARDTDPNMFPDFIKSLDSFYAVTRLKLACEMETRKRVKPETVTNGESPFSWSNLMALLPPDQVQNQPLLAIYSELFLLITENSHSSYEKVETILKENLDRIAQKEQYDILVFLQNYTARQIRRGNRAYLKIAHNLNVFGVDQGFFTKDGTISANHYTSIITAGCKANALDWVKDFAKVYSLKLEPNIREEATKLGEATIQFGMANYTEVLSILQNHYFSDTHCEIRSRSLIMMSIWELKETAKYIQKYSLAFEQYLINRYKKDKSSIIVASLNFVRIFKKIASGSKDKPELITEIESLELLFFREWLLQQARRLP
ncbi:MAG: hypothetical protein HUU01_01990 [Saprospiraceae bacterium]|nr:hypothetical protein [Saprospiraceae bacterium]